MILYEAVTPDKYELPLFIADSLSELAAWAGVTKNCVKSSISHGNKGVTRGRKFLKIELCEDTDIGQEPVQWVDANEDLPVLALGMSYESVAVLVRLKNMRVDKAKYSYFDCKWYRATTGERIYSPVVEWRSV